MGGCTLHRRDKIGNQVEAALQLGVDVRPRLLHPVPKGHHPVVLEQDPEPKDHKDRADHDENDGQHRFPSRNRRLKWPPRPRIWWTGCTTAWHDEVGLPTAT